MEQNKGNEKTIIIVVVAIVGLLFVAGIGQALKDKNATTTPVGTTSQTQKVVTTATPTERPINQTLSLNHDSLLKISKENPGSVIGKTYEMTLYLEQAPTRTQAEFMTQNDDDSLDTMLITCNMSSGDLAKLDGASAQKRDYKPYNLLVTFSNHESQSGLGSSYEAQCALN